MDGRRHLNLLKDLLKRKTQYLCFIRHLENNAVDINENRVANGCTFMKAILKGIKILSLEGNKIFRTKNQRTKYYIHKFTTSDRGSVYILAK